MLPITNTEELHGQLSILDGWYERLGEAGQDFIRTLKAIGTHEIYDPDYIPIAAFHGVGLTTFTNAVVNGPRAVANSLHRLFSIRTHEAVHAIQAFVAPVIHADPVSKRSHVILCPRDYIKLELLKERGAYGGQALFDTLIHRLDTGKSEKISFKFSALADPENAGEIERIKSHMRREVDDLFARDDSDIARHYIGHALDRFEDAMRTDRAEELRSGALRFVRMDEEDIAAVGDGFVINTLVDGEGAVLREYLDAMTLPIEYEVRVRALNKLLGIAEENELLTFGQALAQAGSDKIAFATASIIGDPGVPILRRPGQTPPPLASVPL